MQRKRDGLLPIREAFSGPDGSEKALQDASPQARHHFTQADQVNQLIGASEADPDLGFMARTMALCSLPRSNPGNGLQYKRVNGPFTLYMTATAGNKLPFPPLKGGPGAPYGILSDYLCETYAQLPVIPGSFPRLYAIPIQVIRQIEDIQVVEATTSVDRPKLQKGCF